MKRIFGSKDKDKGKGKEKAKITKPPVSQALSRLETGSSKVSAESSTSKHSQKKTSTETSFTFSSFDHGEGSQTGHSLPRASVSPARMDSLPSPEEYNFLRTLNTIFVIDNSTFMANGWEQLSGEMQNIIPVCAQYEPDGIEVAFPNKRGRFQHVRTAQDVKRIFRRTDASGETPVGEILCMILRSYLQTLEKGESEDRRPLNVVVFLGTVPTDDSPYFEIGNVVERSASRLQRMDAPSSQVSIHFFQVGFLDETADMLNKLGDKCKDGTYVRDIVDINTFRTYDSDLTREAIFGAIERRIDRHRKGKGKA